MMRLKQETAMFSASILAFPDNGVDFNMMVYAFKVKSKIKDQKRSRAVSKSLPQPRPAVQMTNTEALAVLRALHGEPKIIRAKCSFRKTQKNKDRNYVDGGFK